MSKTFTFAGTCVVEGATVYKFANDANRAAVLAKLGATDINMLELPEAMSKEDAIDFLATRGIAAGRAPRASKTAKVAKVAKTEKIAKVATPVAKVKRVGDKPRKGQDPEEFVRLWFAQKEAKVGDRFYPKKAA
jgi:hypothetical protein